MSTFLHPLRFSHNHSSNKRTEKSKTKRTIDREKKRFQAFDGSFYIHDKIFLCSRKDKYAQTFFSNIGNIYFHDV